MMINVNNADGEERRKQYLLILFTWDELEQVPCHEYLETIIKKNGKICQEITNRANQASKTFYQ